MKSKLMLPMLLLMSGFLFFQACKSSKNSTSTATTYSCPMHPEVTGKKGDKCPKCHMALEASATAEMGCCPMHKECTGKMGSKCPKCSMPMDQPVQPYVCPMHPDQKGNKGDHCQKCHMDLVPQKAQKGNG